MRRDPQKGQIDCGPGNLFELPGQVAGGVRRLGAQSAEGSVALKGPGPWSFSTHSTACVRDKEPSLESHVISRSKGLEGEDRRPLTSSCSLSTPTETNKNSLFLCESIRIKTSSHKNMTLSLKF